MVRKFVRFIFGCVLFLAAVFLFNQDEKAQAVERYFPATGHTIQGEFLQYYESTNDAERLFGSPITEAYIDIYSGQFVQYFENARFESNPSESGAQVHLADLGTLLYEADLSQPPGFLLEKPGCQSFATSQGEFWICHAFLDAFKKYGGKEVLGEPISNPQYYQGYLTQFFQNIKLVYHPELPPREHIQADSLGRAYFALLSESPALLTALDHPQQAILDLDIHVTSSHAITGPAGEQTIFVMVQDQTLQPVSGAYVRIHVRLPDGAEIPFSLEVPTDVMGKASLPFAFQSATAGQAIVWVTVTSGSLQEQTTASFLVWR